jgi:hypothetical protein
MNRREDCSRALATRAADDDASDGRPSARIVVVGGTTAGPPLRHAVD